MGRRVYSYSRELRPIPVYPDDARAAALFAGFVVYVLVEFWVADDGTAFVESTVHAPLAVFDLFALDLRHLVGLVVQSRVVGRHHPGRRRRQPLLSGFAWRLVGCQGLEATSARCYRFDGDAHHRLLFARGGCCSDHLCAAGRAAGPVGSLFPGQLAQPGACARFAGCACGALSFTGWPGAYLFYLAGAQGLSNRDEQLG